MAKQIDEYLAVVDREYDGAAIDEDQLTAFHRLVTEGLGSYAMIEELRSRGYSITKDGVA